MYNPETKAKVKELRKRGFSINDLTNNFKINKSTVSYWCRDILLSEKSIQKIRVKGREKSVKALLKYSESKRKERIARTLINKNDGAKLVGQLNERDIMMVGMGLYWGEGYKESNGEMGFTNSSPEMIKFYMEWLRLWKVNKDDLIFRLTINSIYKKYDSQIESFWTHLLGVNISQFSKTTCIKTVIKKGFERDIGVYKGILRVKVKKGLFLKNKILGAIDHISKFKLD